MVNMFQQLLTRAYKALPNLEYALERSQQSVFIFRQALHDQRITDEPYSYRLQHFQSGIVGVPSVPGVRQRIRRLVSSRLSAPNPALPSSFLTSACVDVLATFIWDEVIPLIPPTEGLPYHISEIAVISGNFDTQEVQKSFTAFQQERYVRTTSKFHYLHKSIDTYLTIKN